MIFDGFPVAALDFYDDLEQDNSKAFWDAHRHTYESAVKAPMQALGEALEDEFGSAKIFRPHRDVRFSKDKTHYKTHQGLYVAAAEATGWYVQLSAAGVMVGVGFYDASPARLAVLRRVIDGPDGATLERLVSGLTASGWEVGGDTVKTTPRGYSADHPRIALLRHKSMTLSKHYGFGPEIHSAKLLGRVRDDWRAGAPFVEWVAAHI
ncbi:DUF2461 domain-containing protein [Yimella sp. cx-573]|nr:DUF2461 domain-containing protein [Yimella sp. cx-573]